MHDGRYGFFVTALVLALVVTAVAALWMLGSPSSFQTPFARPNLLPAAATPAVEAPATTGLPGQAPATSAPASRRVGQSRIDVNVPPRRETEVRAGFEIPPTETATAPVPAAVDVVTTDASPEPLLSSEIYSDRDADVTPPTAKHPQQFAFQGFDLPAREIVTFELIIDEQGRVESTRVMNASPTLAGTMLHTVALQAMRAWEFEPALKAGTPVKFRRVLSFFGSGQEVAPQETR